MTGIPAELAALDWPTPEIPRCQLATGHAYGAVATCRDVAHYRVTYRTPALPEWSHEVYACDRHAAAVERHHNNVTHASLAVVIEPI